MLNLLRRLIPARNPFRIFYLRSKGYLAAWRYAHPSRQIPVIGITGTDGKTTTVYFLYQLLKAQGKKVAYMSTVDARIGDTLWNKKNKLTTSSPFELQRFIVAAVEAECEVLILELSSVALDQGRTANMKFIYSAVTNVTPEETQYHQGFENYRGAKMKIISRTQRHLVLNSSDKEFSFFSRSAEKRQIPITTFSLDYEVAEYFPRALVSGEKQSTFILNDQPWCLGVPGRYNVANFLAALALTKLFMAGAFDLSRALTSATSIQLPLGRLQEIPNQKGLNIFVDYALTPYALHSAISDLRERYPDSEIAVVYGATGGGRDRAKRPECGRAISELADRFYLTDDEPYTDDPVQIRAEVRAGVVDESKLIEVADRREAIRRAITESPISGVVLVTGMGAEISRNVGGQEIEWSDIEVIKECLD